MNGIQLRSCAFVTGANSSISPFEDRGARKWPVIDVKGILEDEELQFFGRHA